MLEIRKTRACFWVFVITAWWFARGITTLKIPMILGVTLKPFVNMLHAKKGQTMKNNYFPTLSAALESENLSHAWPCTPIAYGQTIGLTYDDGSKYGYYVSIYRDERGMYERPIHYKRG